MILSKWETHMYINPPVVTHRLQTCFFSTRIQVASLSTLPLERLNSFVKPQGAFSVFAIMEVVLKTLNLIILA